MSKAKKIFLSYASEQNSLASEVSTALSVLGHDVFFDESTLRDGEGYHAKILDAVNNCDLFVFLISPESQKPGKYTLTELGFAKQKWRNPSGKILPVMAIATPYPDIDPYLKAVTILEPEGNLTAEVSASVSSLLKSQIDDKKKKPDTDENTLSGGFKTVKLSVGELITLTTKEWILSLLNQPTVPPFKHDAKFRKEITRVYRLVIAVTLISAVLLGATSIITGDIGALVDSVNGILAILIIALLVALTLRPILYVCGVRIRFADQEGEKAADPKPLEVGQIFYTVLLTFVPWIPIFSFIKSVPVPTNSLFIDLLIISPFICFAYMIVNFAKSIKIISEEAWYRIWLAMIVPFFLTLIYFIV